MEGKFQKNLEVIVDGVGEAGGEVSWMSHAYKNGARYYQGLVREEAGHRGLIKGQGWQC